jgi:hypothetical protein
MPQELSVWGIAKALPPATRKRKVGKLILVGS